MASAAVWTAHLQSSVTGEAAAPAWRGGAEYRAGLKTAATLIQTLFGGVLSGLRSATVLIVGVVTGLFILLFLMKDWRLVVDGTSDRRTINLLRDTGLFVVSTTPSPAAVDVPSPPGGREAAAGPAAAE